MVHVKLELGINPDWTCENGIETEREQRMKIKQTTTCLRFNCKKEEEDLGTSEQVTLEGSAIGKIA